MSSPPPVRVLIVDDHEIMRAGLREMLRDYASVEVVGQAEDVAGCLEAFERLRPDVVLLDINLGNESGFSACVEMLRRRAEAKILFLSAFEDEMHLFESLRVGGSGYLLTGIHADGLVKAIKRVSQGRRAIDRDMIGRLPVATSVRARCHDWPGATHGLSRRESEVLQGMAHGLSNRQIAQQFFISEETVKSHVKAVLRKLHAQDRAHGIVIAMRDRIVR